MTVSNRHVDKKQKLSVLFCEVLGVFLIELLNTTGGVNQFLLAGEKGMAG
jgi:hypothetical protein